ncbi:DUF4124 domain-containing protein [Aliikangiella coralliicola]|uniref:DUF4124 domain-containing protein n=1 Tax=Aliikangiella coralliicola TaxID=2592383 RepID=A0A545UFZ6_9GAMM|nr:DUF4124 domain-containing protein [Aliikangiella coralliicola]TQV88389.1 DUF4124 domain-containing protein [Aliikangiella coralliicola]
MKVIYLLIAVMSLTIFSTKTLATIYKCKSPSGKIAYSDKPCKGETQSVKSEVSKGHESNIEFLNKRIVERLLRNLEAASKARNANRLISYFTPDADITLDLPANLGGKQKMSVSKYKETLVLGWSVPGNISAKMEDVVITLSEDKKSAYVTATVVESLEMDSNVIMSTRATEQLTVVIKNGVSLIDKMYVKLEL